MKNNTQRSLKEASITVRIPDGVEFQTASDSGSFNPVSRNVSWLLPQLQPAEEIQVSLSVVPRSVGTRELSAVAKTSANHQADVTTQIKVEGFAALAVRVPDERGPVVKGERVSLRYRVVNRGSANASQVVVKCRFPEQLEFISAEGSAKAEQSGQVVQFTPVGILSPNQELTFDLVFNAKIAGDARVEFEASSDQVTTPIKHQEQVVVYGD